MDESHYRTLIEEVRNDIAEAERTIEELQTLESYLQKKIESPGQPAPKSGGAKSSGGRSSSRAAAKAEPGPAGTGGKGMQTVEFGPDGFPST